MEQADVHLPRFAELPDLGLYLDQVQYILEDALQPLTGDPAGSITGTMITNYVKQKVIAPTSRKKYSREQLAQLLVIFLLKRVLTAAELALILRELLQTGDLPGAYDAFCREAERHLQAPDAPGGEDGCPPLTAAAVRALSGKLQFEQLVREQAAQGARL